MSLSSVWVHDKFKWAKLTHTLFTQTRFTYSSTHMAGGGGVWSLQYFDSQINNKY
jgi:hypothetical protein